MENNINRLRLRFLILEFPPVASDPDCPWKKPSVEDDWTLGPVNTSLPRVVLVSGPSCHTWFVVTQGISTNNLPYFHQTNQIENFPQENFEQKKKTAKYTKTRRRESIEMQRLLLWRLYFSSSSVIAEAKAFSSFRWNYLNCWSKFLSEKAGALSLTMWLEF